MDQAAFCTAMDDENTASVIAPWKDSMIEFAATQLTMSQSRDDYRELLELTIIFLGGIPPRGIHFFYPGAIHRARWMAKAINAIKVWLFRGEFPLQQQQQPRLSRGTSYSVRMWAHLQQVCLFTTRIYVRYWFQSPLPTQVPRNDLDMLCALTVYPNEVASAAITAFQRLNLSELLVGFAFFDDGVSTEEKRLMVSAMRDNEGSDQPLKRIEPFNDPAFKCMHHFVTKSTKRFFKTLELSDNFLDEDPSAWRNLDTYTTSQDIVKSIKVVNDLAECGVALIHHFNASLTRNEEQKPFLLQVVEDHRTTFTALIKASAVKRLRLQ